MKGNLKKSHESKVGSEFAISAQKWASITPQKKVDLVCWSLQTSLLRIVGELAEGGSMAVAVGVSDR